ncbi:MAG: 30S ribosome-binding factor RbfA [Acidimicrobiales bacterium]|nr:30S ribosome-binding factor RbfA [Actinomycetota bacterium]
MKKRPTARDYPRTARLNTLVREILADELERIDDERLELVTLTAVVVDSDLGRAAVYYDHSRGDDADEEIAEAFAALRTRLQSAVGRQTQLKRTPELRFEPDGVLRDALRIEEVLRGLSAEPPVPPVESIDPPDAR